MEKVMKVTAKGTKGLDMESIITVMETLMTVIGIKTRKMERVNFG